MNIKKLINTLDYESNPAFLQGKQLEKHHGYSFFFAHARKKDHCNLKGVYALLDSSNKLSSSSLTPVVYVCQADNETEAGKIHKKVWNQNIVPFLIVVTPKKIRLYSGFEYDHRKSDEERVLAVAENANEVLDRLSALKSESIDSGNIWKQEQIPVSVEGRVDRHLLEDLKKLSEVLTGNEYNLPIEYAHSLIGKYIYLKYLRDRDILSDKQFKKLETNHKRMRRFEPAEQKRVRNNFNQMRQFKPRRRKRINENFRKFQKLPSDRKQHFRQRFAPELMKRRRQQRPENLENRGHFNQEPSQFRNIPERKPGNNSDLFKHQKPERSRRPEGKTNDFRQRKPNKSQNNFDEQRRPRTRWREINNYRKKIGPSENYKDLKGGHKRIRRKPGSSSGEERAIRPDRESRNDQKHQAREKRHRERPDNRFRPDTKNTDRKHRPQNFSGSSRPIKRGLNTAF